jgi:hypothetical protein
MKPQLLRITKLPKLVISRPRLTAAVLLGLSGLPSLFIFELLYVNYLISNQILVTPHYLQLTSPPEIWSLWGMVWKRVWGGILLGREIFWGVAPGVHLLMHERLLIWFMYLVSAIWPVPIYLIWEKTLATFASGVERLWRYLK